MVVRLYIYIYISLIIKYYYRDRTFSTEINCTQIMIGIKTDISILLNDRLKFVTLKRHTPDKFDQFLEDNFFTGRAISMTLCMKITVTIVLVLRSSKLQGR
jgi:hypothetical protein